MNGRDEREALAEWLGGQVESFNVTDPSDEQTTWIEVGVDDLADRIVGSDWLAARVEAARAEGADEGLRDVRDKWQWGAWSDMPDRVPPPAVPAIARAQHVTEWLTEQLEAMSGHDSEDGA